MTQVNISPNFSRTNWTNTWILLQIDNSPRFNGKASQIITNYARKKVSPIVLSWQLLIDITFLMFATSIFNASLANEMDTCKNLKLMFNTGLQPRIKISFDDRTVVFE